MNTSLFTVFDSAANRFLDIFSAPTVEFALREFRAAVNKPGHQFNLYPADYTLFCIGTFDPEKGSVTALEAVVNLGVAITLVNQPDIVPVKEA